MTPCSVFTPSGTKENLRMGSFKAQASSVDMMAWSLKENSKMDVLRAMVSTAAVVCPSHGQYCLSMVGHNNPCLYLQGCWPSQMEPMGSHETRAYSKTTNCRGEKNVQGQCSVRRPPPPALAVWPFDRPGPWRSGASTFQEDLRDVYLYTPLLAPLYVFTLSSPSRHDFPSPSSSSYSLHSGLERTYSWTWPNHGFLCDRLEMHNTMKHTNHLTPNAAVYPVFCFHKQCCWLFFFSRIIHFHTSNNRIWDTFHLILAQGGGVKSVCLRRI